MSESIKTGGVGKSPAIEKINRLNEVSSVCRQQPCWKERHLANSRKSGSSAFKEQESRS